MPDLPARSGASAGDPPATLDGDDGAWFEWVFRRHYAGLCTYVDRLVGSPAAAEDVVQDLFAAVWERRAEWRARGASLPPVLYISARNRAFNALKRRRLEIRSHLLLDTDGHTPGGADDEVRWGEIKGEIDRAVATLPEQCRLIFTLSRRDGMTYGQIAQALQISVKTVETQMGRALKSLRARLATHLAALAVLVLLRAPGWPQVCSVASSDARAPRCEQTR